MNNTEKVAGILGGMGPAATIDMMQRILRLTPALDDADHVRCIVDNNPKVPSRIKAIIEGGGEDPGPVLADMARRLESWGADYLAIPCNTAHYYYEVVANAVTIPVINLIDIVVSHVKKTDPGCRRIGVLASTAVLMTGLYENAFKSIGIDVVYPDTSSQEKMLQVIKDVKSGRNSQTIVHQYADICEALKPSGVESVVIACTELSLLPCHPYFTTVDSADILARHIVNISKNGYDIFTDYKICQ